MDQCILQIALNETYNIPMYQNEFNKISYQINKLKDVIFWFKVEMLVFFLIIFNKERARGDLRQDGSSTINKITEKMQLHIQKKNHLTKTISSLYCLNLTVVLVFKFSFFD